MHIYIDETGIVESQKFFGLGGIIVKDISKEADDKKFLRDLCERFSIDYTTLHSAEIKQQKNFFIEFINYIKQNPNITPFFFGNNEEPKILKNDLMLKDFEGSRYIEILINFLEYVLFINNNLGKNIKGIHFASRTINFPATELTKLNNYKSLGYSISKEISDKKTDKKIKLVYVWDESRCSAVIFALMHKYKKLTFNLNLIKIEGKNKSQQRKEDLIYYKFADICSNIVYKVKTRYLDIDIEQIYNPFLIYKIREFDYLSTIFRAYYNKDYLEFFFNISKIKNKHFEELVDFLLEKLFEEVNNPKDEKIKSVYSYLNRILDEKQGNYSYVIKIGNILLKKFKNNLPFELAESLQRAYNHIGDYKYTDQLARYCAKKLDEKKTFENLLKKAEIINRHAISLTNIFYFKKAKQEIENILPEIEKLKDYFKEIKFELLGKIYGTYGQILALIGDNNCEKYFLKAIQNFSTDKDIYIQYSYLCHFYLDVNSYDKFLEYFEKRFDKSFKDVLIMALKQKIDPYFFELILKYIYKTENYKEYILNSWEDLYNLYYSEDHPFEKIAGFLYLILYKNGKIISKLGNYLLTTKDLDKITIELIKKYFILISNMNKKKKQRHLVEFIKKIKEDKKDYFELLFEQGPFQDVYENRNDLKTIELYINKFKFYFG